MRNETSWRQRRSGDDGAAVAAMAAAGLVVALLASAVAMEALVTALGHQQWVPFLH